MGRKKKTTKVIYQCEICKGTQDEPVVACDKCDKWHHFACVGIKSIGKKDTWFCKECKPPSVHSSNSQPSAKIASVHSTKSKESASELISRRKEKLTLPSNTRNAEADFNLTYDLNHPYYQESRHTSTVLSISSYRQVENTPNRRVDKSVPSSSRASTTSQVTDQTRRIELEFIEEERNLREERDRQYLDEKYRILMKGKANSEKRSDPSRSVASSYTKSWISDQKTVKSTEEKDEFIKKMQKLRLDNTHVVDKNIRSPNIIRDRPVIKGMIGLLKCEICKMVGKDEKFGDCLLCFKQFHFACMDIITIDNDTSYICPNCKKDTGRSQHSSKRSYQLTTKPEKVEQVNQSKHRCYTCGRIDNQEIFRPCDICDKLYHYLCMTLSSIEGEIVWVCSECKRSGVKVTTKGDSNQFHHSTPITTKHPETITTKQSQAIGPDVREKRVQELLAVDSKPSASLTTAQIASRHVVTRDLPIFTGKPEQWPMFLSRFENSTQLCGYSDSENLDRLQKCLKGSALEAVRSRLLTAESVPEIMSTLEMLYGRPELIVNALMRKIRNELPPKADKLNTLVDFALSVRNVCATLEQANLNYHLSNPALIQELVEKLPTNIKIEWAKFKGNIPDVNLSTLGNFLYDLAKVISTVTEPTMVKESTNKEPYNKEYKKESNDAKRDSSVVYAHQNQNQDRELKADGKLEFKGKLSTNKNPEQCCICNKKCQKVASCPVFLSYDTDQRWKQMYKNKLCRKCLDKHGRFCTQAKMCGVNGCIFKHHSLLHDEKKHSQEASVASRSETVTKNNNIHFSTLRSVLLRIIPVTLYHGDQFIKTFAYQDDGSDISMIEESLVNSLGIHGYPAPLCLLWTADVHRKEDNSKCVNFEISGQNEFLEHYWLHEARTVATLGLPIQSISQKELIDKFPYLKDIPFIEYQNAVPQILIGSDNAHLNVPHTIVEGTFNQPIACHSRIGWSVHGRTINQQSRNEDQVTNIHRVKCPCQHQIDEELHRLVKEHYTVENFGVQVNKNLKFCSKEDERALDLLKQHTRYIEDRYETALLWRYDDIKLPDSYGMALKRLQCLERHKPQTIDVINKTIEEYIRKGYVTKLNEADVQENENWRIWYLPIFTVSSPKKPDKVRVVFDGAAKVKGVSLNSLLLTGPDQLSSLVDILRRFREKKVAAVGDIAEMFHQIKIRREDVHAQRFLWRNGDANKRPDQYVLEVMTFGANCSPASAQFVKNKNASEFKDIFPRAVDSIINNHYVDDMLDCQDSDQEMIQLINEVKQIHKHGGFEIRNFLSNSTAVKQKCNYESRELQCENCIDMSFGIERVLGMWWNTEIDCFTFSLKYTKIDDDVINGKRMPVKRELLKILMSIFDPLGLISHYLIHLKIILQDVWRSKLDWDEEITSNEIKMAWKNWLDILPNVEKIEIPRLYSMKMSPWTAESIELHIFVDASEKAFSAVAYLRVEDDKGVDCVLVGSKARVTPLKYLSIPRQELQAGVLGTRLLSSLDNAQTFKIHRRQIWTDSLTLLSWICSDSRKYHQFVAHRIGEILETTNLQDWRWIPSHHNVADEATKWTKPPSMNNTSRWFSGPEFLKLPRSDWPGKECFEPDTLEEMKIHYAHSSLIVPILINPHNISNWRIMLRTMAYARRYVLILRAKVRKEAIPFGPLTRDELKRAEILLFRQAQFQDFTEEMVLLLRNQQLPKHQQKYVPKSSPLYKLSPYLDESGLIRHHGRIDLASDVAYSTKRPIILPRNNRITHLLVNNFHRLYHHRNNRTVYNEIRQQFFIPQLRVVLNSVRNHCQKCKNRRAKAQPPEMADLPPARLAIGFRAFTYIGIDYFGPMFVAIGRRNEKRWGVLITCLTVRAVHVEIAYKLDTNSCIMCIRNFINLRGCPEEIYSDQGTNLKGMDNELTKLVSEINVETMATELTTCYTKWCFNPPHSPHMSGAWERMVGLVKTCLYDILPTRHPTEDMLRSLLLEVCNIVNSRPLTYVPLEHDDDDILTPNHFIMGTSNGLKPMIDIESDGPILRSKWMENQRLTEIFWTKFIKEFLPDLTRRTKWYEPVEPIKVDDIVLLVDETNVRGQYPKCRVIETFIGSNNQVRRARIQRINNQGSKLRQSILLRPVTSLAKLDVHRPESSLPVHQENRQTEGSVMNGNTGQDSPKNDSPDLGEQTSVGLPRRD